MLRFVDAAALLALRPSAAGSERVMCAQSSERSPWMAVYIDDLWRSLEETAPSDGEKETYTDSKNM